MAVVRKKQDDRNLRILRELVTNGGNRQCFDCRQKGPTYVNMTIGSFVCTKCSGILRGLTPPHRVKSISMATFSYDEIEFLKSHGNDICAKTWLGLWDPKRLVHQEQRELMIDKYERKRYYLEPASPLKSLTNSTTIKLSGGETSSRTGDNSFAPSITSSNNNSINYALPNAASSSRSIHEGVKFAQNSNNSASTSLEMNKTQKYPQNSDFVADFSSANIFNATTSINNKPKSQLDHFSKSSNNIKFNNIPAPINNDKQFGSNGFKINNDSSKNANMVNANENFADFEHAPIIYNAAGLPMSNPTLKSSVLNPSFNTTNNLVPSVDRYAALKDLDEQLRENKAAAAVDTFSNTQAPQLGGNPFKSQVSQAQQLQQAINPFQSTLIQQQNNIFGMQSQTMTNALNNNNNNNNTQMFGSDMAATGFNTDSFTIQPSNNTLLTNNIGNGCGFHVGQQRISENSLTSNIKNPFIASSLNSNNPFL